MIRARPKAASRWLPPLGAGLLALPLLINSLITFTPARASSANRYDINGDGWVDDRDLQLVKDHFGWHGLPNAHPADVNGDGEVDIEDLALVGLHQTSTTSQVIPQPTSTSTSAPPTQIAQPSATVRDATTPTLAGVATATRVPIAATASPTVIATLAPTNTAAVRPTATATPSAVAAGTSTSSPTATATSTASPTSTATPGLTLTPIATLTLTATPRAVGMVPSATPAVRTNMLGPATQVTAAAPQAAGQLAIASAASVPGLAGMLLSAEQFAAGLFAPETALAATPPVFVVTAPTDNTKTVGDTFQVGVAVDTHGASITGWQFGFDYDPTILAIQTTGSATPSRVGTFTSWFSDQAGPLGASPFTVNFKLTQDNTTTSPGHVARGGQTISGQPANTGISGSGSVVNFTFTALAAGSSPITLRDLKMTDVNAQAIAGVTVTGSQTVVIAGATGGGNTATPTLTATPTPSGTPTLPPTSGPTSTITTTPTITPTGIGGVSCPTQNRPILHGTSMTMTGSAHFQEGETASFTVSLDTGSTPSFGMEFGLAYDPAVIQVLAITPTSFYGDPASLIVQRWLLTTPGSVNIGGVSMLDATTGVTGNAAVATVSVKGLHAGPAKLVMTCPVDEVADPIHPPANQVRLPETYRSSELVVDPKADASPTPTLEPSPTPHPDPPVIGNVVVEDKSVNVGDTFVLNVTLSDLLAKHLLRGVQFGIVSEPKGVVKVTSVGVGTAFSRFVAASNGTSSVGILPVFKVDSDGNVPVPGGIELTANGGAILVGPTNGVVATIKMTAVTAGSAKVRLFLLQQAPPNGTPTPTTYGKIFDQMKLTTLATDDTNPTQARPLTGWVKLSGGNVTVGNAISSPTTTPTSGTATPTPTVTPTGTTTAGPTLTTGPTNTLVATLLPTATPGAATSNSTLGFLPVNSAAKAGDSFSVDVQLNADRPVRGIQFGVSYNPAVVHVDHVDPGPFFTDWANANGSSAANLPTWDADNGTGTVSLGGLVLLGGLGGPSGTGSVAKVFFKAQADGTSPLTLTNAKVAVQTTDTATGSVAITVTSGQVIVGVGAQATVSALATQSSGAPGQPGVIAPTGGVPGVPGTGSPTDLTGAVPVDQSQSGGQAPLVTFDSAGVPQFAAPGIAVDVAGAQQNATSGGPAAPGAARSAQAPNTNVTRTGGPNPGGPAGATNNGNPAGDVGATPGVGTPATSSLAVGTPGLSTTPGTPGPAGARPGGPSPTPGGPRSPGASSSTLAFDISKSVDTSGVVMQEVRVAAPDGSVRLLLPAGTVALTSDRRPLRSIQVTPSDDLPIVPNDVVVAGAGYEFGPSGATFSPPITIAFPYDPAQIPETMAVDNVEPAFFDLNHNSWVSLTGTVDPTGQSVTAQVAHFTTFAVLTRRSGTNWALVAGIILLELGLGALGAMMIPRWRRRYGGGLPKFPSWLHLPRWLSPQRGQRRARVPRLPVTSDPERRN